MLGSFGQPGLVVERGARCEVRGGRGGDWSALGGGFAWAWWMRLAPCRARVGVGAR